MRKGILLPVLVFVFLSFASLTAAKVEASTRTVDTVSDSASLVNCNNAVANDCSLRGAITNANSGDTINFSPTVFAAAQTINLGSQIFIDGGKTLQITGPGANLLTLTGIGNTAGFFYLFSGTTSIQNMTMASVAGSDSFAVKVLNSGTVGMVGNCIIHDIFAASLSSAGLYAQEGSLTVNNTELYSNTVGIGSSAASLTISGTTVRNSSKYGLIVGAAATISNSIIKDNAGITAQGMLIGSSAAGSTITVSNSLFTGNGPVSTTVTGGAVLLLGGNLILNNSTLSGNTASQGSAIGVQVFGSGSLTLNNTTVTANNTTGGSAIEMQSFTASTIRNSIIAGNTGSSNPDIFGNISNASNNLLGVADSRFTGFIDGGGAPINNNLVGTAANPLDPRLAPLSANGGATMTHALLSGSPAVNHGSNCVLTANGCGDNNAPLAADQRGQTRPLGGTVDIGSVEQNITLNQVTIPNGMLNTPYNQQLSAVRITGLTGQTSSMTDEVFAPAQFAVVPASNESLPPGVTLSGGGLLSGIATMNGTYTFTVKATDTDGMAGAQKYTMMVLMPTAAGVSIGGKILTADGRGLSNASVKITDQNGSVRTVQTSAFGVYRFDEVKPGQIYSIGVSSKRYQFAPQIVSLTDSLSELNFSAIP